MKGLDAILSHAVAAGDVPFLVAMSGTSSGVSWSGVAGERAPGLAAAEDTVCRIFSMSKAVGATAAMILIDRGRLDLDTPAEEILPRFGEIKVLDGFDGATPRLRAPKVKPTVCHLATHTSGFAYESFNRDVLRYLEVTGCPSIASGLEASLNYPLVSEPGERWDYSIGVDWLGQMVEAVDGRRIDAFCHNEIFDPLDMPDTSFEVTDRVANRLAAVQARSEAGRFVDSDLSPPSKPEFYGMGHALYSTAPDYMRFLRMFLNKGQLDGCRILGEAGVEMMLANHIGQLRVGKLTTLNPSLTANVEFFPGFEKTHSLGFLRTEEDVPEMRAAGSQSWAGALNTHFWFDPACDVAGLVMTQSLPFMDPRFMKVYRRFERAVYAKAAWTRRGRGTRKGNGKSGIARRKHRFV